LSDRQHPSVEIVWADQRAEIDVGIADLILGLWQRGIRTCQSCENNLGRVWIEFSSAGDAELFLTAITRAARAADSVIYRRVVDSPGRSDEEIRARTAAYSDEDLSDYPPFAEPDDWWYGANLRDEGCTVFVSISVRFPVDVLSFVLDAVADDAHW
jgi:hypothetical protein